MTTSQQPPTHLAGVAQTGTVARRPERPPRTGQPWTDAEYREILAAAREGETDIERVAERIGRSLYPTLAKARRLLPVTERAAPVDRVLVLLRRHQEEDPDYDWQRVTLEEPPLRPVVNPPALTGLPGLSGEDLLEIGYAVLVAASAVGPEVVQRVAEEVDRRGLYWALVEYRADRLLRRPGAELTYDRAVEEAAAWLRRVLPRSDDFGGGWAVEEPWHTMPHGW